MHDKEDNIKTYNDIKIELEENKYPIIIFRKDKVLLIINILKDRQKKTSEILNKFFTK